MLAVLVGHCATSDSASRPPFRTLLYIAASSVELALFLVACGDPHVDPKTRILHGSAVSLGTSNITGATHRGSLSLSLLSCLPLLVAAVSGQSVPVTSS